MSSLETIRNIYSCLYDTYGPQKWWPADSPFEVMVGAVLTQNTNWKNVEKAINNLKNANVLSPSRLYKIDDLRLAELIKPSGYFNVKTRRLKNMLKWMIEEYDGDIETISELADWRLREELLTIKGIGPETADSIMLYAFNRRVFVVDTYTARIFGRHLVIDEYTDYTEIQELCESAIEPDVKIYNTFHAFLVQVGSKYCKPKPRCEDCPLKHLPKDIEEMF